MLGLKLPTDPRWAALAESNIEEILNDHAWCEHKAASNAMSLMLHYPELTELVDTMQTIAVEELEHFNLVHQKIKERGLSLGKEKKDFYVNDILAFVRKGLARHIVLVDRLLFGAMIEARSCERFKMLAEKTNDQDLAFFYRELMVSEANHYTTFIKLAKKYAKEVDVEARWKEFLEYEASVISQYGKNYTMHG